MKLIHKGSSRGDETLTLKRYLTQQLKYLSLVTSTAAKVFVLALGATSACTANAETLTISGRVLNPDGTPAVQLPLCIMPVVNSSIVATDTNGFYQIKWTPDNSPGQNPSRYCLLVRDLKRNLAAAEDIDESTTNLDLRLAPGQIIAGRVEDPNGKPLSNAVVHLVFWSGNTGSWIDQDRIKVDAQGRFEDVALPRDRRYEFGATAEGYGSAEGQILKDKGDRIEAAPLVLKPANQRIAGVVVDADGKPIPKIVLRTFGRGQPRAKGESDDSGQFSFNVCEGAVTICAYQGNPNGSVQVQSGDTNVVVTLGVNANPRSQPQKRRLKGTALPNLAPLGFSSDAAPTNKPILLCFFDIEQRPSRRFVTHLTEQYDALRQKGVTLLGVQATLTSTNTLQEWKTANPVPFPVGGVAEKTPDTKWVLDVQSLPWLILTDEKGRITAEGFELDELDTKLKMK